MDWQEEVAGSEMTVDLICDRKKNRADHRVTTRSWLEL